MSADYHHSLVTWINSFDTSVTCTSLADLHSGVTLFEICQLFAPRHFSSTLVKKDVDDNWLLKLNNLKALVLNLDTYYTEVLHQSADFASIDLSRIARDADEKETAIVVEFVLGACVQCPDKEKYIQRIVTLDHTAQQHLMRAIERIMNSVSEAVSHSNNPALDASVLLATPLRSDPKESQASREEREVLTHALSALQTEVVELQQHCDSLEKDSSEWAETKVKLEARIAEAETDLEAGEARKKEMATLRAELEYCKAQAAQDATELDHALQKARDSTSLSKENKRLKDEIDVLRERAAAADHLEVQVLKYKKKTEEIVDIRRQLRDAEQLSSQYAERCLDLEEEAHKVPALKAQVAAYKDRISDLEGHEADGAMNVGVLTEELERARNEVIEAKQDAERRAAEVAQLERRLEVLLSSSDQPAEESSLEQEITAQHKQQSLLSRLSNDAETQNRIEMLETMLDDARRMKDKAQRECTTARQELTRDRADADATTARLKGENEILSTRLSSSTHELKKLQLRIDEMNRELERSQRQCASLTAAMTDIQNDLVTTRTQLELVDVEERERAAGATATLQQRFEEENARLKHTVDELEHGHRDLRDSIGKLEKERDDLTAQIDELTTENKTHMTELHAVMREKDAISADLIRSREEAIEREHNLAAIQTTLKERLNEVARYRSEVQRLNDSHTSALTGHGDGREIEVLRLKLEREEGLLSEARAKVSAAQAEKMRLQTDRDKLNSMLTQAKVVIQEHKLRAAQTAASDRAALEDQFGATIAELQRELAEKEKEAIFHKRVREDVVAEQRREEHLVMSAFYDMGLDLIRLKQNIGTPSVSGRTPPRPLPVSWLGKERKKI